MSDTVKSSEEKNHLIRLQHESERSEILRDMQAKEAIVIEKHTQEISDLQSELRSKMNGVTQQLHEANEKWNSRPSLPKDMENIKSL